MNYLTEHLSFYAWLKQNPRGTPFQSLWNYLLVRNNNAAIRGEDGVMYWPVWFGVDNSDLRRLLDEQDAKRIWEHRRKLITAGLIEYQPGSGGKSGAYALIPFNRSQTRLQVIPQGGGEAITVWNPPGNSPGTALGALLEAQAEPGAVSSDCNNINNKYINIKEPYRYEGEPPVPYFNQLPRLTTEEMDRLSAIHTDEAALVEAMWALKEQKKREEER
ncbi:hypothetical protein [Eubacterium sp. 1001713B170207_170306_E7]|uniref:hypothetical protein n=1 Tax=Eubacterium sp. 1001713B170207_170306_E7 TaxID=2787097 RepID=UPI00189B8F1C|nr:hypothetical protein [Eubacterium sp. 1001713B170207_170306_E7]